MNSPQDNYSVGYDAVAAEFFGLRRAKTQAAFPCGLSAASSFVPRLNFVGVHPDSRQAGVGRALYDAFFDLARSANRTRVCCVTSPVNQSSIAFHRAMGFDVKPSQTTIDGLPYHPDYDGPGEDRVVFVKPLDPSVASTIETVERP